MNSKEFSQKMLLIFEDRNIPEPSPSWIGALFEQIKNYSDEILKQGFQKIMLIHQEEWNKNYGYNGKPALTEWLNFFGQRPKTDDEKIEELKKYEDRMIYFVGCIIAWLYQPALTEHRYFVDKYKDPQNGHLKTIIDQYARISYDLPNERLIKLASSLKLKYEEDKESFKRKLLNISKYQNPPPFVLEKQSQVLNIVQLPTLKKM